MVNLDPYYVKDLQAMYADEMVKELNIYAAPFDRHIKEQV